jgi:hypothetical protein
LNIAPHNPIKAETKQQIDGLLGTLGDKEIAEKFNVSKAFIQRRRYLNNIKPQRENRWKDIDGLLGSVEDVANARQIYR